MFRTFVHYSPSRAEITVKFDLHINEHKIGSTHSNDNFTVWHSLCVWFLNNCLIGCNCKLGKSAKKCQKSN